VEAAFTRARVVGLAHGTARPLGARTAVFGIEKGVHRVLAAAFARVTTGRRVAGGTGDELSVVVPRKIAARKRFLGKLAAMHRRTQLDTSAACLEKVCRRWIAAIGVQRVGREVALAQ